MEEPLDMFRFNALIFTSALAVAACGDSGTDDGSVYFSGAQSAALGAAGNQADCATCHDNDGNKRGRPGNSMKDIAYRMAFKGGDAPTLRDGVNACVIGWMGGAALAADDEKYVALEAYLQSISDPMVTAMNPLAPEVLADDAAWEAAYAGGDAAAGAAKYEAVCAGCHASGKILGMTGSVAKAEIAESPAGYIAQKVRTSGPPPSDMSGGADNTPGPMPFFEPSDLSVQDLKDIIAHIKG